MRCETAKRKVHLIVVAIMRLLTNDDHGANTQGNRAHRFNIGGSTQRHIHINRVTARCFSIGHYLVFAALHRISASTFLSMAFFLAPSPPLTT
jgi:hypothetical protein